MSWGSRNAHDGYWEGIASFVENRERILLIIDPNSHPTTYSDNLAICTSLFVARKETDDLLIRLESPRRPSRVHGFLTSSPSPHFTPCLRGRNRLDPSRGGAAMENGRHGGDLMSREHLVN